MYIINSLHKNRLISIVYSFLSAYFISVLIIHSYSILDICQYPFCLFINLSIYLYRNYSTTLVFFVDYILLFIFNKQCHTMNIFKTFDRNYVKPIDIWKFSFSGSKSNEFFPNLVKQSGQCLGGRVNHQMDKKKVNHIQEN